jgi:cytochrome c-type biogenesis protein CcmH
MAPGVASTSALLRRGALGWMASPAGIVPLVLLVSVAAGMAVLRLAQVAEIDATAPAVAGGDTDAPDERRRVLEQQVRHQPRDARAWALLAYDDLEAGRHVDAAAAFEKAIAASPKVANDASLLCDYAEALALAQGGMLEGRPTEWVMRALALKPGHPKALEMAGSAAYERRDFGGAARYWQKLRTGLAAAPLQQREALDAAIARAQRLDATSLR